MPGHDIFMRQALVQAEAARAAGEVPVGAVLVREGQVLAEAFNEPIRTHDPTAHAEVVALRRAAALAGNYRLAGCTLYVTLEPCLMCVGALVHARVDTVVYGASDPKAGAIVSLLDLQALPLNHRFTAISGVLAEESGDLLRSFFRAKRDAG